MMKKIRIAGVPEHFNLPWHLGIENSDFSSENIDLQWINVPEGTGKMCQMLRENETDIAVILTEGIIKDIVGGNPSKIIQIYVESPLLWGIHVSSKSKFNSISDLEHAKVAISRKGSGSHLMAYIHADNQNWDTKKLDFEIVNTIEGAVDALSKGEADYFMWEHFMTKPLVDNGIFKRLGDCPTPWPCFVIVARNNFIENNADYLQKILNIINKITFSFKNIQNIEKTLSEKYNLNLEDIQQWLDLTDWSDKKIDKKTINAIQKKLFELNIIDKIGTFAEITISK